MFSKDKQETLLIALTATPEKPVDEIDSLSKTISLTDYAQLVTTTIDSYIETIATFPSKGLKTMTKIDAMVTGMANTLEGVDGLQGKADSTKLLAINAAIEAAKNQGEAIGFVKVAHEVRKLASRSEEFSRAVVDEFGVAKESMDKARSIVIKAAEEEAAVALICKSQIDTYICELLACGSKPEKDKALSWKTGSVRGDNEAAEITSELRFPSTPDLNVGNRRHTDLLTSFSRMISDKRGKVLEGDFDSARGALKSIEGIVSELLVRLDKIRESKHVESAIKANLTLIVEELQTIESAKIFVKKD